MKKIEEPQEAENRTKPKTSKDKTRVRSKASEANIKFFASLSYKKESRRRPPVKKPRKKVMPSELLGVLIYIKK